MGETLTLDEALRDPAKASAVWDHSRPKPKALARLGELVNLEELGLFKAQELPPSIGGLTKLRKLSLGKSLPALPDEVAALGPRLEELWLDGGLPDDVERLLGLLAPAPRLRKLQLYEAREVPPSLAKLRGPFALVFDVAEGADPGLTADLAKVKGLVDLDLRQGKKKKKAPDLRLDLLAPLKKLRRLALRFGFRGLPDELGQLAALEELELQDVTAKALPEGLRRLKKLRRLVAKYGVELEALPGWIGELRALEELRLPQNPLGSLPESLGRLSRLRVLELPSCGLTRLPDGVGALPLEELRLQGNALTALPPGLEAQPLRALDLRCNQLAALPAGLVNVAELDVDGNPCWEQVHAARKEPEDELCLRGDEAACPSDAFDLEAKRWVIEMPRLKRLPPAVAGLKHLEELVLKGCSALDLGDALALLAKVKGLRSLWASDLKAVPESLGALTGLEALTLGWSPRLTALPDGLGRLSKLRELCLFRAGVASLPESIGELSGLTRLDLRECPLRSLPDGLAKLEQLVGENNGPALALSETRFKAPPPVLARLQVTSLSLGKNDPPLDGAALLTLLAENPRLEALTLEAGSVKSVPAELGLLTGLKRLTAFGLALPPELAKLERLERVALGKRSAGPKEVKAVLPPGRWKWTGYAFERSPG